jgi:hypothetical protein
VETRRVDDHVRFNLDPDSIAADGGSRRKRRRARAEMGL